MPKVTVEFPVKTNAGPPWPYPTLHVEPFNFSFEVERAPTTALGALIAASFFRDRFLDETRAKRISSLMQSLTPMKGENLPWIPGCYLSGDVAAYVDNVRLAEK